ncbi:hypothetical protein ACIGB6_14705 [Paeniglutamicibacter gangotriensis]|nr:hypothetical protein [Paeniglutamicibacter gangotriensis]
MNPRGPLAKPLALKGRGTYRFGAVVPGVDALYDADKEALRRSPTLLC